MHLPSERSAQQLVIHHRLLVHWLNEYYVQVHVPALGVLLVWLFVRHRDRYPRVRNVVALVTGACLLIQLFPVAPPRLLPHIGVLDTGALIGPSTYAGGAPGIDQLSAMPSMHVAWALIVGGAVVWVSKRRYRWLALLYPAATVVVVVLTGNHYWADAIVAAAICVLAAYLMLRVVPTWASRLAGPAPDPEPCSNACSNPQCSNWHIADWYNQPCPAPPPDPPREGTRSTTGLPPKVIISPAATTSSPPFSPACATASTWCCSRPAATARRRCCGPPKPA